MTKDHIDTRRAERTPDFILFPQMTISEFWARRQAIDGEQATTCGQHGRIAGDERVPEPAMSTGRDKLR